MICFFLFLGNYVEYIIFRYQVHIFMLPVSCQKRSEKAVGLKGVTNFCLRYFCLGMERTSLYAMQIILRTFCHRTYITNKLNKVHAKPGIPQFLVNTPSQNNLSPPFPSPIMPNFRGSMDGSHTILCFINNVVTSTACTSFSIHFCL